MFETNKHVKTNNLHLKTFGKKSAFEGYVDEIINYGRTIRVKTNSSIFGYKTISSRYLEIIT